MTREFGFTSIGEKQPISTMFQTGDVVKPIDDQHALAANYNFADGTIVEDWEWFTVGRETYNEAGDAFYLINSMGSPTTVGMPVAALEEHFVLRSAKRAALPAVGDQVKFNANLPEWMAGWENALATVINATPSDITVALEDGTEVFLYASDLVNVTPITRSATRQEFDIDYKTHVANAADTLGITDLAHISEESLIAIEDYLAADPATAHAARYVAQHMGVGMNIQGWINDPNGMSFPYYPTSY